MPESPRDRTGGSGQRAHTNSEGVPALAGQVGFLVG